MQFPECLQTLNIKQKLFVEFINVLCLCSHDSGQTHDISHISVHYLRSFSVLVFKNIFGPFVPSELKAELKAALVSSEAKNLCIEYIYR